jgi:ABC-type sugar transport system permease subunit
VGRSATAAASRAEHVFDLMARYKTLYFLVLPFAVLSVVLGLWPIVVSVLVSFTDSYTALSADPTYIGVANYADILSDPLFHSSILGTLFYTAISVVLNVTVALGLALLLASEGVRRGSTLFKLAIFLPVVTPEIATYIVWKWMFNQDFGAVNAMLANMGLPLFPGITTSWSAFATLLIVELWQHVGFYTLVFLTNIQLLDPSLDEAARMDGANKWTRIRKIWVPQLRPAIAINTIYALIQFLKTFTVVLVITKGGPNYATNFVSYYAYTKFDMAQYGHAMAMATILFGIVLVITLAMHVYNERRDYR